MAVVLMATTGFSQASLKFDGTSGSQLIVDSTNFSWSGLTAMSYTMWAKGDWSVGNNYLFDIADSNGYNNGSNSFRYGIYEFNNQFGLTVFFNGQSTSCEVSANNLPTSEWFHVAATINRTQVNGTRKTFQMRLYINGELMQQTNMQINSTSVSHLFLSPKSNVRMGSRFTTTNNSNLTGNLDEVVFYDRELSSSEVKEMVCNSTSPSNGRILYYKCNSGSGNTVYDLSSSGVNATMTSSVTWDTEFVNDVSKSPVADFNFTTTTPSLNVSFRDSSSTAVSYKWEFGDGDTSANRNPNHTYKKQGTYKVGLTTTDVCGKVSAKKERTVVVTCPPAKASFLATPNSRKVTFEANKLGITNFTWNFGDGSPLASGDSMSTVNYIYPNFGSFKACLYVESACGMDTLCEDLTLEALGLVENSMHSKWSVYPNPAKGNLGIKTIEMAGAINVEIHDLQGRLVYVTSFEGNEMNLNIEALNSGMYSIQLSSEQGVSTKKFMVE